MFRGFTIVVLLLVLVGCSASEKKGTTEIIAGTSLIADIIADVTDASVATYTLLPSSSCPSQFDMKASDIGRLQQSRLIFLHPWQLQLANIRRVLEAAKIPEDRIRIVEVPGNWMVPEVQVDAAKTLAAILIALYPEEPASIQQRVENRINEINTTAKRAEALINTAKGIPILCNEMQAPFLRWAGFDVVATYARPEDWSVAETERLVALGREHKVALVVDNLQSGGLRMSETLARDIGAINVVLSNFPKGLPATPTWQTTFMENIHRLHKALETSLNVGVASNPACKHHKKSSTVIARHEAISLTDKLSCNTRLLRASQ